MRKMKMLALLDCEIKAIAAANGKGSEDAGRYPITNFLKKLASGRKDRIDGGAAINRDKPQELPRNVSGQQTPPGKGNQEKNKEKSQQPSKGNDTTGNNNPPQQLGPVPKPSAGALDSTSSHGFATINTLVVTKCGDTQKSFTLLADVAPDGVFTDISFRIWLGMVANDFSLTIHELLQMFDLTYEGSKVNSARFMRGLLGSFTASSRTREFRLQPKAPKPNETVNQANQFVRKRSPEDDSQGPALKKRA
ncbi:hypothetical protein AJ80_00513 [Polytolypa hystricis UAMH7299]|uniref:Uncharacterized protein n=1 Tax=Polytolypa hystricis (strain UAMH7299) TaxID=1447883 RepID=A0A2B7Z1B8_POLH7|nr:hypothetical protein AJ80_00513 [Polytolypa hystricis UAMH7299]